MSDENENEPLDLVVDSYSLVEKLKILNLIDDNTYDNTEDDNEILKSISKDDILTATNNYISNFKNHDDEDMANFFQEIQTNLINLKKNYQNNTPYNYNNPENTILPPTVINYDRYATSSNLLADGDNINVPVINQKTQNIVTTFAPSEVQGVVNPLLKTSYSTFINIDSKYRQHTSTNSNTDFTLDLSEPLKKLLSLQLYSYQIPYSWYTINDQLGNTCFWIEDSKTNIVVNIRIDPGNYTPTSLTIELNEKIVEAGFVFDSTTTPPFTYKETQGKIIFNLYGGVYKKKEKDSFVIDETTKIIFFDFNFLLECNSPNCGVKLPNYINQTLGWILGFRSPFVNVISTGNVPPALLDLNGTRYLILIIDDFKQNHLNNNLISITEYDNNLKLPSYYNKSLTYSCNNQINNSNLITNNAIIDNDINADNIILDKLNINYIRTQNILPSAPRTLTQSQIYTINEIIRNNSNKVNYFPQAPTNSDVFAVLPVKNGNDIGKVITETTGSLQTIMRSYMGPVDVQRLRITLCDDTGRQLELNDLSWSVTLIANCLYELN
jgi:hypothetical protein